MKNRLHQVVVDLPAGVISKAGIQNIGELAQHLAAVVKREKLCGYATVVSVPANIVKFQKLSLPADFTKAEVVTELRLHIENQAIASSDDRLIDFYRRPIQGSEYVDVYAASLSKKNLVQYQTLFSGLALQLRIVTVDACQVIHLLQLIKPEIKNDKKYVLLCQSQTTSVLVVWRSQQLIAYHYWNASISTVNMEAWLSGCIHGQPFADVEKIFRVIGRDMLTKEFHLECEELVLEDHFSQDINNPFALALACSWER